MNVIAEFPCDIRFGLPAGPSKGNVVRKVNKHHIGKETIPMDEKAPQNLVNVHYNLHRMYSTKVMVQVLEDGTLRLKNH